MDLSKRSVSVLRGQITKLSKSINAYLGSDESKPKDNDVGSLNSIEEELVVLLERIKAAHATLKIANSEVLAVIKPDETEKEIEKCAEYDDTVVSAIARLNQRLTRIKLFQDSNIHRHATNFISQEKRSGVKLPKLNLRIFSGNFSEWIQFWEQFKTAVHENPGLSSIDKFNYLQSVLKGRAAEVLAGFTPTENCYDSAIALLLDEFGNPEKLIDQHIQRLLSMKPVLSKTDTAGLRRLYNSVVTCVRSLAALGVPSNHYGVILKTLILKCLPAELRVDFHRVYDDSARDEGNEKSKSAILSKDDVSESSTTLSLGDGQIKALLRYLKREVDSLEKASEGSRISMNSSSPKLMKTAAGLFATTFSKMNCFFCESDKHDSSECNDGRTVEQRKDLLKKDSRCFRCTKKGHTSKFCKRINVSCVKCKKKHASSMCEPLYSERYKSTPEEKIPPRDQGCASITKPTLNLCATNDKHDPLADVFLQTACVHVFEPHQSELNLLARLVFDGGSQLSFIRQDISRKLGLPIVGTHILSVAPFGSQSQNPAQTCNRVRMVLRSQYDDEVHLLEAIEVPHICVDVLPVPDSKSPIFYELSLADSRTAKMQLEPGISILIGADQYWNFVTGNVKRISDNLTAVQSLFGWTLQGPVSSGITLASLNLLSRVSLCTSIINEFDFRKLWDLEAIGIKKDELEAETFTKNFCQDYIIKLNNRYKATLPWKNLNEPLLSNRTGALGRLKSLTRKLLMEVGRAADYDKAIRAFLSAGFAERVQPTDMSERVYYLPHRPVYREDKVTTKLRVVFDASAHEPSQLSLNDHVLTGSNLLADILKVLLNFRMGVIGVTADIEKAFLQILLDERDRDSHRFFWYNEEPKSLINLPKIQEYRMTRVTFGVTCSPFLLGATIQKHLENESKLFPHTCSVLKECFYMDDLVTSVDSEVAALKLCEEAKVIMKRASMNLRQWNSNNDKVRSVFSDSPIPKQKILGIPWLVISDELTVDLSSVLSFINTSTEGTKRNILQTIARMYDPLGFFGPCTLGLKILFQTAWRLKLSWDAVLPTDLLQAWHDFRKDLLDLEKLTFPRCVQNDDELRETEIHIFCDASLKGYGCAAYVRTIDRTGGITVRFLIGKNRVAPLKETGTKELTLPRLELTAAVLASRLSNFLWRNLRITFKTVLWTDSQITLHWILGTLKKWKPYVANRVKEIRELTSIEEWRHCPGVDNPADLLTRGLRVRQLINSELWKEGPTWLKDHTDHWPPNEFDNDDLPTVAILTVELASPQPGTIIEPLLPFKEYSKWRKLLRVTAFCLRFINRVRRSRERIGNGDGKFLTASELQAAELYWISYVQRIFYENELNAIRANRKIPHTSKIETLRPIIDEEGLLRVDSRLRFFTDFRTSHPIILPKESYISELVAKDRHEETLHGGVNLVLSRIREKFWIPKARQLIKAVIKQCIFCRMMSAQPMSQPFAPLPRERMLSSHPFETTGIDFAGPLYTKPSSAPESVSQKVYIMLFTCATVRAIHLELVMDLTTESCLLGLRRFISRRGTPQYIYSDNARTFKRASKEIAVLQKVLNDEEFHDFLSRHRISWRFIVERAPWWGGFWERMVRSVKNILKAAIKKSTLKKDELNTLLVETESIINSRPLTYMSDDPLDMEPLTPMHFLEGRYATMLPSSSSITKSTQLSEKSIRQLWVNRCKLIDFIWKRWRLDYLQQLRSLHHHPKGGFSSTLKLGDVVQVHDSSAPRLFWKLAVVTNVFPGRDGKIRACELRLSNGTTMRRPIQLLYPIEISG